MQGDWEEDYLNAPEAAESNEVSKNESSLEACYGDDGSTLLRLYIASLEN